MWGRGCPQKRHYQEYKLQETNSEIQIEKKAWCEEQIPFPKWKYQYSLRNRQFKCNSNISISQQQGVLREKFYKSLRLSSHCKSKLQVTQKYCQKCQLHKERFSWHTTKTRFVRFIALVRNNMQRQKSSQQLQGDKTLFFFSLAANCLPTQFY